MITDRILLVLMAHPYATAWDVACLMREPERVGAISARLLQLKRLGRVERWKNRRKPRRGWQYAAVRRNGQELIVLTGGTRS